MEQDNKRQKLYSLLGDLPPRDRTPFVKESRVEERDLYIFERLSLDLNGMEDVSACFIKPKNRQGERLPAILYNHAHGGLGKDELIEGAPGINKPPFDNDLISAGYAVLAIDAWNFGDRAKRDETDLFKETLWKGQILWGLMVYDTLKAFEYLAGRKDVDEKRIGTLGMSMGSTMSIWATALMPRIKLCVDVCCLTDFDELIKEDNLKEHGIYYFVPGLLKHFTMAQINELIAPRPHLSLAGLKDPLTPPKGLDRIDAVLKEAYKNLGAEENWHLIRYDCGHVELPEMRKATMDFLKKRL